MKYLHLLFALLIVLLPAALSAQQKNMYDIEVAGINIGTMETSHWTKGEYTYYYCKSEVSVWLFFRVHVLYDLTCIYHKGQLISSIENTDANKDLYYSKVTWNKDHYDVAVDAHKYTNNKPINQKVEFSSLLLYFQMPALNQKMLSEHYGVMTQAKLSEPNVIELDVLGKTNKFYYENGVHVKTEVENAIKNFIMTKRK
jgi:hypothetical protein